MDCLHLITYSRYWETHYNDVIMGLMESQITSLTIVYSTVYSGADQRKHQSSASLAFVRGMHRSPVNSPHKGPVTRKMFPCDDVMVNANTVNWAMYSWYIVQDLYLHSKCTGDTAILPEASVQMQQQFWFLRCTNVVDIEGNFTNYGHFQLKFQRWVVKKNTSVSSNYWAISVYAGQFGNASTTRIIQLSAWNLVGWYIVPWSRSLFKMAI